MNLWVRSQDKRILQKVDNIFLDANYENKRISTYDGDSVELGTYKTKERAIEILDEIQDELISSDFMPIEKNEEVVLTCGSARIYEMPEDWEKDWYYV